MAQPRIARGEFRSVGCRLTAQRAGLLIVLLGLGAHASLARADVPLVIGPHTFVADRDPLGAAASFDQGFGETFTAPPNPNGALLLTSYLLVPGDYQGPAGGAVSFGFTIEELGAMGPGSGQVLYTTSLSWGGGHDQALIIVPPGGVPMIPGRQYVAYVTYQGGPPNAVIAWAQSHVPGLGTKWPGGVMWARSGAGWLTVTDSDLDFSINFDRAPVVLQNGSASQLWYVSTGGGDDGILKGTVTSRMTSVSAPAGWAVMGEADINHDLNPDIIWYSATLRQIMVWYMSGSTRLSTSVVSTIYQDGFVPLGVLDFDNNGDADILWYQPSTKTMFMWFMRVSNGTWSVIHGGTSVVVNAPWMPIATGYFQGGDVSKPDILLQNQTTNQLLIWQMNGTAPVPPGINVVGALPAGSSVIAVANITGNPWPDVVLGGGAAVKDYQIIPSAGAYTLTPDFDLLTPLPSGWSVQAPR